MAFPRKPVLAGLGFFGTLLVAFGAMTAISWWRGDGAGNGAAVALAPDDVAVVAEGAKIYAANCASCHGADLEGQPNWRERKADGKLPAPPHDRDGHTWHHPDVQLFHLVKNGLPKTVGDQPYLTDMPAYAGILTDAEIVAVLSYIKSRWPADIRRSHDELNDRLAGYNPN
ncbi:c-type cytochrome [Acuticoccus sediminis]|nr:cytochrome c [Acuticoccus sediminis]